MHEVVDGFIFILFKIFCITSDYIELAGPSSISEEEKKEDDSPPAADGLRWQPDDGKNKKKEDEGDDRQQAGGQQLMAVRTGWQNLSKVKKKKKSYMGPTGYLSHPARLPVQVRARPAGSPDCDTYKVEMELNNNFIDQYMSLTFIYTCSQ